MVTNHFNKYPDTGSGLAPVEVSIRLLIDNVDIKWSQIFDHDLCTARLLSSVEEDNI